MSQSEQYGVFRLELYPKLRRAKSDCARHLSIAGDTPLTEMLEIALERCKIVGDEPANKREAALMLVALYPGWRYPPLKFVETQPAYEQPENDYIVYR